MANTKSIKGTFYSRFWSRVNRTNDDSCWEWTASRFPKGYGKVALPRNGVSRRSSRVDGAHRIAWILTHGPITDGLWVLHRCDNRLCCRPDHLYLGTVQDNANDMVERGRSRSGNSGVLSGEIVRAIRSRVGSGSTLRGLARELGVARGTVRNIARRKAYKHVP